MERSGNETRIDHRSYKRQGIDQIPTVHMGVAAFQMEQRGIATERGNINREIAVTNQQLRQLKARINKLENWLKDEAANTEPPTLSDVIQGILSGGDKSHYDTIRDLKSAAKMLSFLQTNNIKDMADLEKKVISMYSKQGGIREKLKPVERRLKTLKEHIYESENYFKYREFYDHYKKQKPKKQPQYYEDFRMEISLFESAKRYLEEHLNGHKTVPTKSWKDEQKRLSAEQAALNNDYKKLKEETREVEVIRRNVEQILRSNRLRQKSREQGMEL